jgi:acyl-[acyl-carrier-protein]-phospholipid O-acyltransferase/long-chain-fatty-acid--[acyl-carrier-protein] ligase
MTGQGTSVGDLDTLKVLPRRNRVSLLVLMLLTGLNAFNDNLLKMLLVGLAPKVVEGSLGRDIGLWLGAILLLPYILFAPLSGYLSDRFSKKAVIIAMLVLQSTVLLAAGGVFEAALGERGVLLALGLFFLLALQSTIFSPAKMGVLKELAGSRRLGRVSGGLQMMTMAGILGGLSVGGPWFDALFVRHQDAWQAAAAPVWVLFWVSLAALALGFAMQATAVHGRVPFRLGVLWEHFANVRETLAQRGLRWACAGVAIYWFVASMAGAMFVDIGLVLHPDRSSGGAASAASFMTLMVGLGTAGGSLLVSAACGRGVQLGIVPLGALGMALALAGAGGWPASLGAFDVSLVVLGLSSACFMVPVQAYIQDQAEPSKRGRVLSSMNLLDSVAGVLSVLVLFGLKKGFGLAYNEQFWLLAVLMLVVAMVGVRLLSREVIRFLGRGILRMVYRVRGLHVAEVPQTGGALMLPNHVSYMDAFLLSTAIERPIRFVIWETIYRVRWFTAALRLFGVVPISPVRAKDAVRSVVQALRDGELVCLFPEGQITRHGMINELRRGFELMVRQAKVPVLPVYLDGMWGSVFSFEGGQFFKKWPTKWRYPVMVNVGRLMRYEAATAEAVREELLRLGSEVFALREGDEQPVEAVNALRLSEVEWHGADEVLWVCKGSDPRVVESVRQYARLRKVKVVDELAAGSGSVVAIGGVEALRAGKGHPGWRDLVKRAVCVVGACDEGGVVEVMEAEGEVGVPVFPAWLCATTGAWISLAVPDPVFSPDQEGEQKGHRRGSLGRLLPGWRVTPRGEGLMLGGFRDDAPAAGVCGGGKLSADGFLMPGGAGDCEAKNPLPTP